MVECRCVKILATMAAFEKVLGEAHDHLPTRILAYCPIPTTDI